MTVHVAPEYFWLLWKESGLSGKTSTSGPYHTSFKCLVFFETNPTFRLLLEAVLRVTSILIHVDRAGPDCP